MRALAAYRTVLAEAPEEAGRSRRSSVINEKVGVEPR